LRKPGFSARIGNSRPTSFWTLRGFGFSLKKNFAEVKKNFAEEAYDPTDDGYYQCLK